MEERLVEPGLEVRLGVLERSESDKFFEEFGEDDVLVAVGSLEDDAVDDAIAVLALREEALDVTADVVLVVGVGLLFLELEDIVEGHVHSFGVLL